MSEIVKLKCTCTSVIHWAFIDHMEQRLKGKHLWPVITAVKRGDSIISVFRFRCYDLSVFKCLIPEVMAP